MPPLPPQHVAVGARVAKRFPPPAGGEGGEQHGAAPPDRWPLFRGRVRVVCVLRTVRFGMSVTELLSSFRCQNYFSF